MKKRGFTLIELLAVIIILAVIALIATPIVLNVVDNAQESARKSSVAGYADATQLAIYDYMSENAGAIPNVQELVTGNKITTKGDKVTCEEVLYSNNYGVVLNTCTVGEVKENSKKYCFASGKTYEDCEDEEFKAIYNSIGSVVVNEGNLAQELIKQYNASNTVGLLKDETGYYYRGTNAEVSNNYVWFAGHLWRVISIDNDNNLTMITQQPLTAIQSTSAVWTSKEKYEASYINTWLNNLETGVFLKSMEQSDRDKILESTFNVGGLYNSTTSVVEDIDGIQTTQKVGLLDEEQYKKSGDGTTGANSFLDINDNFWLSNRYNASSVRFVNCYGNLNNGSPTSMLGVRPVIKISNLTFAEGEGTLESPFREKNTTTSTSNIKVGEYISVPTSGTDCGSDKRCLFRVVSKDNDSIKVVLNGLLPSTSAFGSTATYDNDIAVDTKVQAFAETIDSTYRYTGNKTFNIGTYPSVSGVGQDYTVVQEPKYTGTNEEPVNVGLPVVGEMFSGNDIDVSTSATKIFVNIAAIENPTVSNYFWTMNAYNASSVRNVNFNGNLNGSNPTNAYGVRPVLFLNASSSLTFASGEGTAENPFVLGS